MRALHHSPAPFKRRFFQNGRVWSQGDEDCGLCKLILFDRKQQLSAFWYIVRASVVQCSPQSCSTAQLMEEQWRFYPILIVEANASNVPWSFRVRLKQD